MDLATGLQASEMAIGIAGVIIGLILRAIHGLIVKNEIKSDVKDIELQKEIDKMDDRYRNNDRDLYIQLAKVREELAYMKGVKYCEDDKR